MSTNSNIDSITNQGLFHPKVPRSEPLTTHGVYLLFLSPFVPFCSVTLKLTIKSPQHAPGVLVGNDAIPESKVQTLPAGSAPRERTSKPNLDSSGTGKVGDDGNDQEVAEDARTSAADTRMLPNHHI